MSASGVKLELRNVTKSFGGLPAVDNLSLSLYQGEFLSLLGPSGCGKSTTLSMIAGFESPDSGEIFVDERCVNDIPTRSRGVGIVFQDYAVFGRLSVRENLGFGLAAKGVPKAERTSATEDMAHKLGLTSILATRGDKLNMSEMQRVALGRAIIMKPALLLLDEPMSNLDAEVRLELRSELRQIQTDLGQTVLYVTHDQVEAMAMSDRIAVMNRGQLLQVGPPLDIFLEPKSKFVAEFIGDPPINLIPCTVRKNGAKATLTTAIHDCLPIGNMVSHEYLLAIRPHNIKASHSPAPHSSPSRVRVVENYGSEHVLHTEYGTQSVRVSVPPHFAAVDDEIQLVLDLQHAFLVDPSSDAMIALVTPDRTV